MPLAILVPQKLYDLPDFVRRELITKRCHDGSAAPLCDGVEDHRIGRLVDPLVIGQIGANRAFGFVTVTVGFAMIFKVMPRVRVQWRDVWVGATVTAVLFTVGKYLIGLYIGTTGIASGYGAAGSLVVVLVWVYYSAQIFLLGVEFTWVYAHTFGSLKGVPRPAPGRSPTRQDQPANPP